MADLTTEHRNKLAKSTFGLPGERKYPMPDASHARNAKARASQMEHEGKLSESAKERIDAKADRVLHKGRKSRPEHLAEALKGHSGERREPRGESDDHAFMHHEGMGHEDHRERAETHREHARHFRESGDAKMARMHARTARMHEEKADELEDKMERG